MKIRFTALTNTEDKCVQCWLNELLIRAVEVPKKKAVKKAPLTGASGAF